MKIIFCTVFERRIKKLKLAQGGPPLAEITGARRFENREGRNVGMLEKWQTRNREGHEILLTISDKYSLLSCFLTFVFSWLGLLLGSCFGAALLEQPKP
jgi:hypothetical protein